MSHAQTPQKASSLQLNVERHGELILTRTVEPGTYALGSSADADVRLFHPDVAEIEAVIVFRNGRALVHEVAPRSKVLVNGRPMRSKLLAEDDELRVGPSHPPAA